MTDRDAWVGRMVNWKFDQALDALPDDATENERETTKALADLLGNTGWVFGSLQIVVRAAVASCIGWDVT